MSITRSASLASNATATTSTLSVDCGTAITVTGTAEPSIPVCNNCNSNLGLSHVIGAGPINSLNWPSILSCCQGKTIIVQSNGCNAFCDPGENQLQRLFNCFVNSEGLYVNVESGCDNNSTAPVFNSDLGNLGNLTCPSPTPTISSSTSSSTNPPTRSTASPSPTSAASMLRPKVAGRLEIALGSLVALSLFAGVFL